MFAQVLPFKTVILATKLRDKFWPLEHKHTQGTPV